MPRDGEVDDPPRRLHQVVARPPVRLLAHVVYHDGNDVRLPASKLQARRESQGLVVAAGLRPGPRADECLVDPYRVAETPAACCRQVERLLVPESLEVAAVEERACAEAVVAGNERRRSFKREFDEVCFVIGRVVRRRVVGYGPRGVIIRRLDLRERVNCPPFERREVGKLQRGTRVSQLACEASVDGLNARYLLPVEIYVAGSRKSRYDL